MDVLGGAVAFDGDTLAAGAIGVDDQGDDSGAAYVFERRGSELVRTATLEAPDGGYRTGFGQSVAVEGDTLVVGAQPFYLDYSGAAYVFRRESGEWRFAQKLDQAHLTFGSAVALSGATLAVAAIGDQWQGVGPGAVYVYERLDGAEDEWSLSATVQPGSPIDGQDFGSSIALSGDRLVVGAYADPEVGSWAGAVYVFDRSGDAGWQEVTKLTASDATPQLTFGNSVALDGDRLVVGALYGRSEPGYTGAAYVFERGPAGWHQTAKVLASDLQNGDNFGVRVALEGNRALITNRWHNHGAYEIGSAYLFENGGGTWYQTAELLAPDAYDGQNFGWSAALHHDTSVIGAAWDDQVARMAGAVYLFGTDSDADGWITDFDNCPAVPNPDQVDTNGNGVGDACEAAAR